MKTLERAAQITRERRDHAATAYDQLIRDLAAGRDVQPESVIEIAESAGVGLDQLQADVERVEALAAARKQLTELPAVLSRIAAAEQKQRDLSAELAAFQKRVAAQQEQIACELQAAMAAKARLEEIARQISIGAFDLPAQAASRAQAAKAVAQNGMASRNLRDELSRENRKAAALQATLDQLQSRKQPDRNDTIETKAQLAATKRRIEGIERELRPLERAIAAANETFASLAGGAM